MPWFKVDDGHDANKKVTRIPRARRCAAVGLWLLAGTWSSRNLTDGHIPGYLVEELGGTRRMVADLVDAGLWEVIDDEGEDRWSYPNWSEYQPTRAKVEDYREAERQRKAAAREAARRKREAERRQAQGGAA